MYIFTLVFLPALLYSSAYRVLKKAAALSHVHPEDQEWQSALRIPQSLYVCSDMQTAAKNYGNHKQFINKKRKVWYIP